METIFGYFGADRKNPLHPIEESLAAAGSPLLGFYFQPGLAVEVFSAGRGRTEHRQPYSDAEGETWLALDASPTPTSMGSCSPEHLAKLADEILARRRRAAEWDLDVLREGMTLLAWEPGRKRATALRTSATSPNLFLLNFDNGLVVGSSARPFLRLGVHLKPDFPTLEGILHGGTIPEGSTAIAQLERFEPNTRRALWGEASREAIASPPPAPPASDPFDGIARAVGQDAGDRGSVVLLAVGSPPIDAALAFAMSRSVRNALVAEPILEDNPPLLEGVAGQLGLRYIAKEYPPKRAWEEWIRIIPYLDEPTASVRGLAHLLGVRTMPGAGLYVSSMGLPARLEGTVRPGVARRIKSFFFHRGTASPAPTGAEHDLPQGSRAAFSVLSGLVKGEGLRFSLPLTEPSLGLTGPTPSVVHEKLRSVDLGPSQAALPETRIGDGFSTLVRDAVLPALERDWDDGPRWLRQGVSTDIRDRGKRVAKSNPLGPMFVYTLLEWIRGVGAEVG